MISSGSDVLDNELVKLLLRNNELLMAILKLHQSKYLERELSDKKLQKLYNLTGEKTIKEIAKTLSMGDKTITAVWKRWESNGLLVKEAKGYRRILG